MCVCASVSMRECVHGHGCEYKFAERWHWLGLLLGLHFRKYKHLNWCWCFCCCCRWYYSRCCCRFAEVICCCWRVCLFRIVTHSLISTGRIWVPFYVDIVTVTPHYMPQYICSVFAWKGSMGFSFVYYTIFRWNNLTNESNIGCFYWK